MQIQNGLSILYYFKEYDTPMFQWQRYHIFNDLKSHGWKIKVFNPLDYPSMPQANAELINVAKKGVFDLFFTTCTSDDLFIATVNEIKRLGIPTILFCPDNVLVPFNHKDICSSFDITWLSCKEHHNKFEKWGAKTIFAPYAASPFHKPVLPQKLKNQCLWIGSMYGSRGKSIQDIINQGLPITCHSSYNPTKRPKSHFYINKRLIQNYTTITGIKCVEAWLKNKLHNYSIDVYVPNLRIVNGYLSFDDMMQEYANYALSLSSTFLRHTGVLKKPLNVVNLRSFEIPMSYGLQFCAYSAELSEYFEEDKEIVFFRSKDEMADKAKFYLNPSHMSCVMNMKLNARKRAETDHTWYLRFKYIITQL